METETKTAKIVAVEYPKHPLYINAEYFRVVTVEINGGQAGALHLFAQLPEEPAPAGDNVIVYGAGVHDVGTVTLQSGQTAYLAAGAVVRGQFVADGAEKISIMGQGIIDGSTLLLEWYPDVVTVGGDVKTAYSSGPSLYVDPKTGVARRGRFGSVWQRGDDGAWRVIFDDGIRPEPADAAAVQAFQQGRSQACSSD